MCFTSASEYMRIYVYSDCISELECKSEQKREHNFMLPVVCFCLSVAVLLAVQVGPLIA